MYWGWLKTWKVECSTEISGQHTASEGASHARRETEFAEIAGAEQWVFSSSVQTETPRRFHYSEQGGDLQEKFPKVSQHVFLLYCGSSSIYIVDGRRG